MKDYAFYSGLGMQLLVTILLFAGAGFYMDKKYNNNNPLFIIIFSLLGIGLGLFSVIRQIIKKQK
ncbi:AtpZ/AtpI family protein [Apibacter raozihei]|uniref:AtpZ/AtpI family protein n=1 Tax=Apibacter TaxID=1778601 RepID=UPI000FE2F7F8|nr:MULTISPECIES: AtpZ/AtpI family protein [Apibacter]